MRRLLFAFATDEALFMVYEVLLLEYIVGLVGYVMVLCVAVVDGEIVRMIVHFLLLLVLLPSMREVIVHGLGGTRGRFRHLNKELRVIQKSRVTSSGRSAFVCFALLLACCVHVCVVCRLGFRAGVVELHGAHRRYNCGSKICVVIIVKRAISACNSQGSDK